MFCLDSQSVVSAGANLSPVIDAGLGLTCDRPVGFNRAAGEHRRPVLGMFNFSYLRGVGMLGTPPGGAEPSPAGLEFVLKAGRRFES